MKIVFDNIIDPIDCELKSITKRIGYRHEEISGVIILSLENYYNKFNNNNDHYFSLTNDNCRTYLLKCISRSQTVNKDIAKINFNVELIGERSLPLPVVHTVCEFVREPVYTSVSNIRWYHSNWDDYRISR